MLKRNAKKKRREPKKIGPKKTLVLKKIFTKRTFYLAAVSILIAGGFLFFRNLRYFKLSGIEVIDRSRAIPPEAIKKELRMYEGRNIFDIDIDSISSRIKSGHPVIKKAVVKRVLPNRLEIDIIPRVPVAKIKDRRYYFPVDEDGMVLSPELKSGKLPVIIGLSMWLRPRVGEKLKSGQLRKAFSLIDALKKRKVSVVHSVSVIDVSNLANLSFHFEDGIEVRVGDDDFPERLKKLNETLSSPGLDKGNIKYIDLRFSDVVIGPK